MKTFGKFTILVGIVAATCAYLLNTDVPSGLHADDRLGMRLMHATEQLVHFTARIHSVVTFSHPSTSFRIVSELLASSMLPNKPPAIVERSVSLDGVPARQVLRSVDATTSTRLPTVVFFHGGAWSFGSPKSYADVTRELANATGANVLSVDYRLVPEHPFPAGLDDAVRAVKYVLSSDCNIANVDRSRVILSGDSAGANLALAVSLKLRDEGYAERPKALVIANPFTNGLNFLTRSMWQHERVPLLSKTDMIRYMLDYIDEDYTIKTKGKVEMNRHVSDSMRLTPAWTYAAEFNDPNADHTVTPSAALIRRMEEKLSNPYAFPMMTPTLGDLPETFVLTCEYDVLRDDGLSFVKRLIDESKSPADSEGNGGKRAVHHKNLPCFHGSIIAFRHMRAGRELMDMLIEWTRRAMEHSAQ